MAGLHTGSAQAGEPYDGFQPGFPGLHYDPPDQPAVISRDQAIQAAKDHVGPKAAKEATAIIARHVLLSDDHAYRVDERSVKHYRWQKAPVWVVTFEGVNVSPPSGGRDIHALASRRRSIITRSTLCWMQTPGR